MNSRVALALLCACAAFGADPRPAPRHDPSDQLFRRAPMAESARSVAVNLSTNLHYAFDTELARVHTVWLGNSLNLWGPPYSYAKSPFICDFNGQVLLSFPQVSPWFSEQESLKTRFRAIDTASEKVAFSYEVLTRAKNIPVVESWRADPAAQLLIRTLEFPAGVSQKLSYLAFAESPGSSSITPDSQPLPIVTRSERVNYEVLRITEEGTEKGFARTPVKGNEVRSTIDIPPTDHPFLLTISYKVAFKFEAPALPKPEARIFSPSAERRASSGDEFYRIEHFPLPPEAELLLTGMAWEPSGDLLLCTWLGEVYRVKNALGDPNKATYHRFARGLNEPLGLAVHKGDIYVVQKGELTQLIDSNQDGEADQFRCISSSWGYSGNYHSYSFGPLVEKADRFYVFITGQRGLYNLPFQGWALQINPQTDTAEPFCSGLRVPHGWGFYGPERDVFATDNQGNWIGACRLNHLQKGKFYGFPSSVPASKAAPRAEDVEPPVLWFPRSLAPSASGFDTIVDDRFGPFKGQLLIGDFQNSIVMRACLEKVGGHWQGAVFPFAKGFLSGVNRVSMGPDAKLYVGGGKRTWSTAAPKEFSLDRVSFTGTIPFDVQSVHATEEGFELAFTKPVDSHSGSEAANYLVKQFTYHYHQEYGSPEFDHFGKAGSTETLVEAVEMTEGGRKMRLRIPALRAGYVTSFQLAINSAEDEDLRTDIFYYTLNKRPGVQ